MKIHMSSTLLQVSAAAAVMIGAQLGIVSSAFIAADPGVRAGTAAGAPIAGLSSNQLKYFVAGQADFAEAESVADGLGPRMNLDSCAGCHAHPSIGGSSPAVNPQVAFAGSNGGTDVLPPFLAANGPVR